MGKDDGKTPETPPTPQEQVANQVALTDGVQSVVSVVHDVFGLGPGHAFSVSDDLAKDLNIKPGSTSFEDHVLNAMLDLVEGTKPSDLEHAGSALFKASKAMADAATELRANIKHASEDFQGEAGTAFEKWGTTLAGHTDALSTYVQSAGVEIAAAASGLASVKSSLPPRDTRPADKALKPDKLPVEKRTEGNPEYDEAVKVEKHRQEAINQMNRLASFYSVSAESLGGLTPPKFEAMPNVGVPRPARDLKRFGGESGTETGSTRQAAEVPAASERHVAQETPGPTGSHTTAPPLVHDTITMPDRPVDTNLDRPVDTNLDRPGDTNIDRPVGTEIDSVGTLPPPTTSAPSPQAPVTGPTPTTGGPPVPMPTGYTGPVQGTSRYGGGGTKGPLAPQARPSTSQPATSRPNPARSTTSNPMTSRPSGPGQQGTSRGGMPGASRETTQGGRPSTTSRGVTGGTARPNDAKSGRTSGPGTTGAGRSNGVVGGRPSTSKGTTQNGSRVPRGTVMGDGAPGNSRGTAGRIGQRGVMGAPGTDSAGRSTGAGRKIQGASEAVTGRPTGQSSTARAGRNGFTSGGQGLVRGPSSRRNEDKDDQEGAERPDYVVEDEATHLPQKPRRDVPPVID
ncbi:hypothetical protein [Streptomyces sp. NPDC046939]|uniref:hypothetical protein n=1 Tax=Streptomyces sp. NPDC046939 TaxID=3155376 RepID=UPI0033D73157